jgi:hypothetical protein
LLTGSTTIRDVVLFPTLRPEQSLGAETGRGDSSTSADAE